LLDETLVSLHEKKKQEKWEVTVLVFKITEAEKSNIYNEKIKISPKSIQTVRLSIPITVRSLK
jgi:hypothetical protein